MSDAETLRITIENDGARARLHVPAGEAGDDLDLERLTELARGVKLAVDEDVLAALRTAVDDAAAGAVDRVIAEATEPVDGVDGWLEWERGCEPCPAGSVCNQPVTHERVDHYNRIAYIRVTGGAPVATLHPPTPGEDGRDVRGRVLRAVPGRPCAIQIGRGLALSDGRIVSEHDGVLELASNRLAVSRHFDVPGWIDFSTGNVDFDGTVTVGAGVRDRFVVAASDGLVVSGLVESARLECGGNFSAPVGMAGRDRGELHVGGDAEVGYLNYVRGVIAGTLRVEKELVNCRLEIGDDLIGPEATLLGGDCLVFGVAHVATVGNGRERPTTLVIGPLAGRLRLERLMQRLTTHLATLDDDDATPSPRRKRDRHRPRQSKRDQITTRLAWCRAELDRLATAEPASPDPNPAPLRVEENLHPGVRLLLGRYDLAFHRRLAGPFVISEVADEPPRVRYGRGASSPLADVARIRQRDGNVTD